MRLHLTLALITILALFFTLRSERRHHFGFAQVDIMAQHRAASPFIGPPDNIVSALRKLSPEQDAGIFSKETARLWRRKGLPFQVDFYHPLNSNPLPHFSPNISYVDRKGTHLLPYSPNLFNFLNVAVNPPTPLTFQPPLPDTLGFAGFYVRYPDMANGSNPNSLDGFFSALGASYFRVLARDQVYGLSGRGLAVNTSLDDPKHPEEFPLFTDWWLHEPTSDATELVLDALLDGPSVAGAYSFHIRPGAVTAVDIHASLYFRQDVTRLGIDPFSSMYLFGENASDHFNDTAHQEIHDSDGLLVQSSTDEWSWQPLSQSNDKRTGAKGYQLQDYEIPEQNPKGFGLLQRDRDFQHYQDFGMKYNVRPSAWVIPHTGFEKGEISLLERPSDDFNTDNVVLFWHPADTIKAGMHKEFTYTIEFFMDDPNRPSVAATRETLINVPAPPAPAPPLHFGEPAKAAAATGTATASNPPKPVRPLVGPPWRGHDAKPIPQGTTPVQFLIDFAGDGISNISADQPPDIEVTFDPPATYLREKNVEKNGYDNSWRASFTIIPFQHNIDTKLTCRLSQKGRALTETWRYTWRQ